MKTHYLMPHNEPLFTATLKSDCLNELDPHTNPPISVFRQDNDSTDISYCMSPAITCDTDLMERNKTAFASYYNTAEFQTDRDLVRFFHEAWDHSSRELICKIVDSKAFDNSPERLTSK